MSLATIIMGSPLRAEADGKRTLSQPTHVLLQQIRCGSACSASVKWSAAVPVAASLLSNALCHSVRSAGVLRACVSHLQQATTSIIQRTFVSNYGLSPTHMYYLLASLTVEGLAQRREMRSVGAAFTIGAVGSVVGAVMAFFAATRVGPAGFRLPVTTAAQVAGAIVATYIGGSANLFAGE
jgi:uncharacterized membrane protein